MSNDNITIIITISFVALIALIIILIGVDRRMKAKSVCNNGLVYKFIVSPFYTVRNNLRLAFYRVKGELTRFKNKECWKNYKFCKKYPFMKSRNVWDGRFTGYETTWYEFIPTGWQKAFGQQMLDEIVVACNFKKKIMKQIHWSDIKEKFGELRLYASASDKVQFILDKYEYLSRGYCICCGKPAEYETDGWISYMCKDCFRQDYLHDIGVLKYDSENNKDEQVREITKEDEDNYIKHEAECRLTNLYKPEDFNDSEPNWIVLENGYKTEEEDFKRRRELGYVYNKIRDHEYLIDEKATYGITLKELWGIK